MKHFLNILNIILEDLDSNRKPIQKLEQMSPRQFLNFLREFLPLIKNDRLELEDVRVTEKYDGSAIKLVTADSELLFESSYSGVTTYDKVPFTEAAEWIYNNYRTIFSKIVKELGFNFKLIGELFWIDELVEDGKVTPVGTTYLAKHFGKFGGLIIFDIKKIENNELIDLSDSEIKKIFNKIKDNELSSDFNFYLAQDFNLNKSLRLKLNVNSLLNLINKPEYNKPRFTKADAILVDEIKQIQEDILNQLSEAIDNTQGSFSDTEDLIEGIVFKINSTGNQYGVFSKNYKTTKEQYWHKFNEIKDLYNNWFKDIFGKQRVSAVKTDIENSNLDLNTCEKKFNLTFNGLKQEMKDKFNLLKGDNDIPKATKKVQTKMMEKQLDRINSVTTFDEFLSAYILKDQIQ